MTDNKGKELQAREKKEVTGPAEQTKPGVLFTPSVDIFETEKDLTVIADMPGVKRDDIEIDLRQNVLTLIGDTEAPESSGETDILREYRTGRYLRQFTLSEVIDQSKIEAMMKDGVLRVRLPKVEKAVPRKIAVQAE
jgi:HSP20 family molecular chaperone IbpA